MAAAEMIYDGESVTKWYSFKVPGCKKGEPGWHPWDFAMLMHTVNTDGSERFEPDFGQAELGLSLRGESTILYDAVITMYNVGSGRTIVRNVQGAYVDVKETSFKPHKVKSPIGGKKIMVYPIGIDPEWRLTYVAHVSKDTGYKGIASDGQEVSMVVDETEDDGDIVRSVTIGDTMFEMGEPESENPDWVEIEYALARYAIFWKS